MTTLAWLIPSLIALFLGYKLRQQKALTEAGRESSREAERKQAQDLNRSWESLFATKLNPFLVVGPDGLITEANDHVRFLFGNRTLEGRSIQEVTLDSTISGLIDKVQAGGQAYSAELRLSQRGKAKEESETLILHTEAAPLTNRDGTKCVALTFRDRTQEIRTEQMRRDFIANASHELRTPLAIINGYLENLAEDSNPAFVEKAIAVMSKHGTRLSEIVQGLLTISQLESENEAKLDLSDFSLRSCLDDVFQRLSVIADSQEATLQLALKENYLITGDRLYWDQIFFNLVENALKQNREGSITVTVGAKRRKNGALRLWVQDDGVGIPSHDLPHIFRRFFRVQKHHNQDKVAGTGLGLSIVKRAVEAHGGTISVRSIPGVKTRFSIQLPPAPELEVS